MRDEKEVCTGLQLEDEVKATIEGRFDYDPDLKYLTDKLEIGMNKVGARGIPGGPSPVRDTPLPC